jgi:hypothetical protein
MEALKQVTTIAAEPWAVGGADRVAAQAPRPLVATARWRIDDSATRCVYQAGLLYLALVAAGLTEDHETIVAERLDALGWRGMRSTLPASRARKQKGP